MSSEFASVEIIRHPLLVNMSRRAKRFCRRVVLCRRKSNCPTVWVPKAVGCRNEPDIQRAFDVGACNNPRHPRPSLMHGIIRSEVVAVRVAMNNNLYVDLITVIEESERARA